MPAGRRPLSRTSAVALVVGLVAGIGLVVLGVAAPLYGSSGSAGPATLLQVNGPGVLVVLTMPLILALVATALLLTGRSWARGIAWACAAVTTGLAIVSLLSIGLFVLPVAIALVVACAARTSVPRPPQTA